jgi:hypothetical protein
MIRKTVKDYRRMVKTWNSKYKDERHTERVLCETWWALWIIPIYSQETIIATNI